MFTLLQRLALDQFHDLDPSVNLVILHPSYIQQRLIVYHLLRGQGGVYVRFEGSRLTRADLHAQLNLEVERQMDGRDMSAASTLFLDECDRAAPKELDTFVPEVVDLMRGGRVILTSRFPLRCVATNAELRRRACYLPVQEGLMLWDYARYDYDPMALLEVRSLGRGHVMLNGEPMNDWDGHLPRALFFFLVDKGMTTRSDIFATFWPGLSVREATNVFHVTKRKISEMLGIDLTSFWSGFYHISPQIDLSYDVVRFSELVQQSDVSDAASASHMLRQAIALYRDNFLVTMELQWVQNRREQLRNIYAGALSSLAGRVMANGDHAEALGLYLRAMRTIPYREDVVHSAMEIYRGMAMRQDALLVYNRLEQELSDEFGVSPAPYIQALAAAIQQEIS
jgi:DNA-binding SARP family transcriptional activator